MLRHQMTGRPPAPRQSEGRSKPEPSTYPVACGGGCVVPMGPFKPVLLMASDAERIGAGLLAQDLVLSLEAHGHILLMPVDPS